MDAIILAGGRGTRLRSVVPDLPKPMAPIHDRPFLEYQLDYWMKQGIQRFIFSVGYKWETIRSYFGRQFKGIEIVYSIEEKPLGTGGGMLQALKARRYSAPFLVLNGDTMFKVDLAKLKSFHYKKEAKVTIGLLEVPNKGRYNSVQLGQNEKIVAFQARGSNSRSNLVNGGVYLIEDCIWADEQRDSSEELSVEDQLFPGLLTEGLGFYGFISAAPFIDIGIPEDYYSAASILVKD